MSVSSTVYVATVEAATPVGAATCKRLSRRPLKNLIRNDFPVPAGTICYHSNWQQTKLPLHGQFGASTASTVHGIGMRSNGGCAALHCGFEPLHACLLLALSHSELSASA